MIEPDHPELSIGTQCRLLSISRSAFYYSPLSETDTNLALMLLIDKQFLDTPFYGVRQMTWHLRNDGHPVNEKRNRRLMRLIGLMPIYQAPNTSIPLRGIRPTPICCAARGSNDPARSGCAGITYIPMKRDFLYLVAIMDWHIGLSRHAFHADTLVTMTTGKSTTLKLYLPSRTCTNSESGLQNQLDVPLLRRGNFPVPRLPSEA